MTTPTTRWTLQTLVEMTADLGFRANRAALRAPLRGGSDFEGHGEDDGMPAAEAVAVIDDSPGRLHEALAAALDEPSFASRGRGLACGAALLQTGYEPSGARWIDHVNVALPGDIDGRPLVGQLAVGRGALMLLAGLAIVLRAAVGSLVGASRALLWAAVAVAVVIGLYVGHSRPSYAISADPDARPLPATPAPASSAPVADIRNPDFTRADARH